MAVNQQIEANDGDCILLYVHNANAETTLPVIRYVNGEYRIERSAGLNGIRIGCDSSGAGGIRIDADGKVYVNGSEVNPS